MSRKHFSSALLVSVLALPFVYWLSAQASSLSRSASLIIMITLIFVGSLAAGWLSTRPGAGRNVPGSKQKSTRQHRQTPAQASGIVAEGPRESGQVKWFNASKGFGFITRDSGDDVFVHFRSIRGDGHRILKDGQRVEFSVSMGDKGLQADDVAATGPQRYPQRYPQR